jgi:D-alanyl-D-alanine carboxypeptidase (penicillin-binding protein 5/6)
MLKQYLLAIALTLTTPLALAFETIAPQAILVDADTGTVLFEKDADTPAPPSSMTKIMTTYLVFDRIKSGDISLSDTMPVSEKAWRKGGSKMFVKVGTDVKLDDLLHGILTQSGNDACIVVAESLGGSEESFAETMTKRAVEMGAKNSNFLNSTGWPDEGHVSTPRDLAIIAERTVKDFPELYKDYYGTTEFTCNNIKQGNRNPLLYESGFEADGLKTGTTDAGGHGLVGSATKDGRRLILVVNGLKTTKERRTAARELMTWGFNEFKNVKVASANQAVEKADVWGGAEDTVPLITKEDIVVTVPRRDVKSVEISMVYDAPLASPLQKDQEVGYISVKNKGEELKRFPLYTSKEVQQAGFFQRISNSVNYLIWGKNT